MEEAKANPANRIEKYLQLNNLTDLASRRSYDEGSQGERGREREVGGSWHNEKIFGKTLTLA